MVVECLKIRHSTIHSIIVIHTSKLCIEHFHEFNELQYVSVVLQPFLEIGIKMFQFFPGKFVTYCIVAVLCFGIKVMHPRKSNDSFDLEFLPNGKILDFSLASLKLNSLRLSLSSFQTINPEHSEGTRLIIPEK